MTHVRHILGFVIVGIYVALGVANILDKEWQGAVIAFLFAASNAAIFCWR